MEIIINCSTICSRDDLHQTLADALHFPSWYGKNLDALYDVLAEVTATVHLQNWQQAESALGNYGKNARRVLTHASQRNGPLDILFD